LKKFELIKSQTFKSLKCLRIFNGLKQIKINWITKYNRNTQIDFIDLSDLSPQESGAKLADNYGEEILCDLPSRYDAQIEEAYRLLRGLDKNLIAELDSIAEHLSVNKYLLLAKEFLYIPDGCTSVTAKCTDGVFVGQNLDLGYSGASLLLKKYRNYITVGLKSHPLWATTGINNHGITICGSSVNSSNISNNIIPSIFNAKLILSQCKDVGEAVILLEENKFFVGNDAGSYGISDTNGIAYIECDSKELFHRGELDYCFTINKFIDLQNNHHPESEATLDAIEREQFLETLNPTPSSGFRFIRETLSSHSANTCAHSSKSPRHTTCTVIIDKKRKTLFFTKQLPCKVKSKQEFYKVHLDG
jgi:hypothetical protein